MLAEQGDKDAATSLAHEFKESGPLKEILGTGDASAVFQTYEVLLVTGEDAWPWLCRAANAGYPEAQLEIARMYWNRARTPESILRAYMWYRIAEQQGVVEAQTELAQHRKLLDAAEVSAGDVMVDEWSPGPCPRSD